MPAVGSTSHQFHVQLSRAIQSVATCDIEPRGDPQAAPKAGPLPSRRPQLDKIRLPSASWGSKSKHVHLAIGARDAGKENWSLTQEKTPTGGFPGLGPAMGFQTDPNCPTFGELNDPGVRAKAMMKIMYLGIRFLVQLLEL